jgi:Uma2 family endonuclease
MSTIPPPVAPGPIDYPESDGLPMSDNTKQFEWIVTLADNIKALFHGRDDVFVCGNQNWYPVEGHPEICAAPDVYAVFGRPRGHRPSYKQWEEGNVPMTVVFEIRSPKNTDEEMAAKHLFYEEYGVEEYYLYDPDADSLQAYVRRGSVLARMRFAKEYVSPRMGIRFDLSGEEMVVYHPDGQRFLTFEELKVRADHAQRELDRVEQQLARIKALNLKVVKGQASDEERAELARLLGEGGPAE